LLIRPTWTQAASAAYASGEPSLLFESAATTIMSTKQIAGHDGTRRSRKRRRYSSEFKAEILAECDAPGASVAKVAMSHGINANILHGWRKLARHGGAAIDVVQRDFVPVADCGGASGDPV